MEPIEGTRLTSPMAIFAMGRPSEETDRVADAVLDLRPGMLVVVAPD